MPPLLDALALRARGGHCALVVRACALAAVLWGLQQRGCARLCCCAGARAGSWRCGCCCQRARASKNEIDAELGAFLALAPSARGSIAR